MTKNKLVLFGAGKIGRSFIAQLFSGSNYEVVFVDVNVDLINQINKRGSYKVIFRSDSDEIIDVNNIRGILFNDTDLIEKELFETKYIAVSVGKNALKFVIELLSKIIPKILAENPERKFDIILAENIRNASDMVKELFVKNGVSEQIVKNNIGLIETSIGKMVPISTGPDTDMDVVAEPYNDLILDGEAFKNEIPKIKGLAPKDNIKAWVDRKLFIHNLGHAVVAYFSSVCDSSVQYIWQALEKKEIRDRAKEAMQEAAEVLMRLYPGVFTNEMIALHIDDLLFRFANKALGDTVYRVGCDLQRKLSPEDRLVPVIKYACENKLSYKMTLEALVSAVYFSATDVENNKLSEDEEFALKYGQDIEKILIEHCLFDPFIHSEIIGIAKMTIKADFCN